LSKCPNFRPDILCCNTRASRSFNSNVTIDSATIAITTQLSTTTIKSNQIPRLTTVTPLSPINHSHPNIPTSPSEISFRITSHHTQPKPNHVPQHKNNLPPLPTHPLPNTLLPNPLLDPNLHNLPNHQFRSLHQRLLSPLSSILGPSFHLRRIETRTRC